MYVVITILLGEFNEAKLKRFSIRYDTGYDIKSEKHYNAWLRRYHPKENMTKQGNYVALCVCCMQAATAK